MYICPTCSLPLAVKEKSYLCPQGHCFDIAAKGYVNLLSASGHGIHGDNKLMLNARRSFLSLGHYSAIPETVSEIITSVFNSTESITLLDAGCGEGYYSERLRQNLSEKFSDVDVYGIDVSKDAVAMAAGTYKNIQYSVASVNKLPFPDCSFDIIVSLFAPISEAEFHRVLRKNGILITVSPAPRHLFGLKTAVYDTVYENEETTFAPRLLTPLKNGRYSSVITLSNNKEIYDLFMMTPYYYKTGNKGRAIVESLNSLKTEIGFMFYTFIKL